MTFDGSHYTKCSKQLKHDHDRTDSARVVIIQTLSTKMSFHQRFRHAMAWKSRLKATKRRASVPLRHIVKIFESHDLFEIRLSIA